MAEARLRRFAEGFSFLEVPRWHDGQLWVADMYGGRVLAFAADGSVQTAVDVPGTPTGLGWLHDWRLLVLLRERRLLRLEPCGLVEVCDLAEIGPAVPNELSVDAGGRLYVGVFGLASGGLVRVDPDGTTSRVTADLLLPTARRSPRTGRC